MTFQVNTNVYFAKELKMDDYFYQFQNAEIHKLKSFDTNLNKIVKSYHVVNIR